MMATCRRRAHDEAGATMVEFALVSIVAFMLMLGMFQFGLVILGNSAGSNAARDGARVGIINYATADTGGNSYNAIVAAVQKNLAGNVTNLSVAVKCLDGTTLAQVACNAVVLTQNDLIEVRATWNHKGFGPFMPTVTRSSTARMVIGGAPDLTTAPTTPTTTSPTTTPTTTTPGAQVLDGLTPDAGQRRRRSGRPDRGDILGRVRLVPLRLQHSVNVDPGQCSVRWNSQQRQRLRIRGHALDQRRTGRSGHLGGFVHRGLHADGRVRDRRQRLHDAGPSDGAGPVPISMSDVTDGATNGKPEAGDAYRVTFSESVSPTWTSGSSVDVMFTRGSSTSATTDIQIPNFAEGSFDTGGKYNATSSTVTFSGSTLTASGANLTVTLGSCNTGCSSTIADKGQFTYPPSTTIRDLVAGNVAAGTLSSGNNYFLF